MSRLIDWSDELLVGVREIDAHHKALAGLLNELHEAVHRRRGVTACREAVEKLRRCALSHLEIEDKVLQATSNSDFAGSEAERQELLRQLDDMLARMDDENSNITFHGLHQLKVWLLTHIRSVDAAQNARQARQPVSEGVKVFGLVVKRA